MKLFKLLFFTSVLLLAACQSEKPNQSSSNDMLIYTSIYPLQYIVEQLAGDKATVESIYPPGVDAHTYEPSPREITNLANGDALIFLGAGMESFAETTANALASQDIELIEVGVHHELFSKEAEETQHTEHNHGDVDPHIWIDPLRMIDLGHIIKNELILISPNNEDLIEKNFTHFKEEMQTLDQLFAKTISHKKQKDILVTHAAYGYWEDRYGIHQIAINGLSTDDEPSQKELATITKIAKEKNINYVIFETAASNKIASIVQEHINADKLTIHNLELLTEEEINQGEDYISLMKKNIQVLDQATNDGGI